jgi:hypothetical protein
MANDTFDRDFGYLMPFLDKVAASAQGLEPGARAELQRLVAGEKERWAQIRQLLEGQPNAASPAAAKVAAVATGSQSASKLGLTVGPLKQRSR